MKPQRAFIEAQFPVAKLSKESYKERKAVGGQTLTGLGKWWGRKPLVLVRATVLGALLPATDDPAKDREVFLKLMTMDADGLHLRRSKNLSAKEIYARLSPEERKQYFERPVGDRVAFKRGLSAEDRKALQLRVFDSLGYDEKLNYCKRPEHMGGLSASAWAEINTHLGTKANSLPSLLEALGQSLYNRRPRVGDAFAGGGSIPYEAARIGCDAFASDLNPVAGLLTDGALHIVGGGDKAAREIEAVQARVYADVDKRLIELGIEHNKKGWRADAFLYCVEITCPECGWGVPVSGSWVVASKTGSFVELVPDKKLKSYRFKVVDGATAEQLEVASHGNVEDSEFRCPSCGPKAAGIPVNSLRRDRSTDNGSANALRQWDASDIVPRTDDIFRERLYCIRWVERYLDKQGIEHIRRHYRAPDLDDLEREASVLKLVQSNLAKWQRNGLVPTRPIEPGQKTDEPIRTRGWTYWHHLFLPRQLLLAALFADALVRLRGPLLLLGRIVNASSKLSRWKVSQGGGIGGVMDTYDNQALNTLYNFAARGWLSFRTSKLAIGGMGGDGADEEESPEVEDSSTAVTGTCQIAVADARQVEASCDLWITDPPFADAVNYHELSEFFLAWYERLIPKVHPDWYTESKRALAITGEPSNFRAAMVDCYRNLTAHMPDNGIQVVMFTHQDAAVWADLALILWASGLRVTAAWTIVTETDTSRRVGNYVQGTVLLVLRKQTSDETGFLDEITQDIRKEVERQLGEMQGLDDSADPNFGDADYQLAAYAAALRVLTSYRHIAEIDLERELKRDRNVAEKSPVEEVIERAVRIASNFLIPKSLHDNDSTRRDIWLSLTPEERLFLKGLEVEAHGEYRQGVYQEFARGFGVRDYRFMLYSDRANETRLKTASEFRRATLDESGFGSTLVRHALFGVFKTRDSESAQDGLTWLRTELPGYWAARETLMALLQYFSRLPMPEWKEDAEAARLLAGAVENDRV